MSHKALIIGINYTGSKHELGGCINDAYNVRNFLVNERGFPDEGENIVVMTDEPDNAESWRYPTYENMVNAMKWLINDSGPGDSLWLSYSGHGGQTADTNGDAPGGYDDTICPVDFESSGQIYSTALHDTLVMPLHDRARLTILFDCCHSGSACELPFVYRPDAEGNIVSIATLAKNALLEGTRLMDSTKDFFDGEDGRGFSLSRDTLQEAGTLFSGFSGLAKDIGDVAQAAWNGGEGEENEPNEDGLVKADHEWIDEHSAVVKDVWMFSGCADNQTSADTKIGGMATGAMSWAFITTMQQLGEPSYIDILTNAREMLQQNYSQIPQLSCGGEYDLDQRIVMSEFQAVLNWSSSVS